MTPLKFSLIFIFPHTPQKRGERREKKLGSRNKIKLIFGKREKLGHREKRHVRTEEEGCVVLRRSFSSSTPLLSK